MVLDLLYALGKQIIKPLHSQSVSVALLGLFIHTPAADKTEGVPNLTAEVTALFYLRFIVEDVASR